MGAAWRNKHLAKIAPCCFQRKMVGNFERGRQKSCRENRLHRCSGSCGGCKCSRQGSARRRKWQQTQRDLRHHTEHSFRTDKEADQIESGFVFMHTSAGPQDFSIRQHYLKSDHVIARHAIFQAARTARVSRNVAANRAIFHTRWVRRIK